MIIYRILFSNIMKVLSIRHSDPSVVQDARSLALSLVGTLQQDFVQWQKEQQAVQQHLVYAFTQPYYSGYV